MTKLQAIRWFMGFVLDDNITFARDKCEGTNFAMDISDKNPRIKLPKDMNNLEYDESDKLFRKGFTDNYPMTQGFSNITLILLHECGHWATRSVMDIVEYSIMVDKAEGQKEYMTIPWERIATDWAICWLSSPVNRKIAKRFEKQYFGY